jgi:hypothetical protein
LQLRRWLDAQSLARVSEFEHHRRKTAAVVFKALMPSLTLKTVLTAVVSNQAIERKAEAREDRLGKFG